MPTAWDTTKSLAPSEATGMIELKERAQGLTEADTAGRVTKAAFQEVCWGQYTQHGPIPHGLKPLHAPCHFTFLLPQTLRHALEPLHALYKQLCGE